MKSRAVTHSQSHNKTEPKLPSNSCSQARSLRSAKLSKIFPSKEKVLAMVLLFLVGGSLLLAVIDETTRPAFTDLTKVALGGYMGLLIPRDKKKP